MSGIMAPWVVAVALITYRSVSGKTTANPPFKGFPLPSEYVAAMGVFGLLGVIDHAGGQASSLATLVGWGFDAAIFLNLFSRPQAGVAAGQAIDAQKKATQVALDKSLGAPAAG